MKTLILFLFIILSISAVSQTQFVLSYDSVRIAYEVHSETRKEGMPVLVFVHGWSCDRTYWRNQVQYFAKKLKVVSIDLAGHGESGLNRKAWTMESFGGDVEAVASKLDLHNVILVGHSIGGDVVIEAGLKLRDRTSGLILVDSYRKLNEGHSTETINGIVGSLRKDFTGTTDKFVRSMFLPHADKKMVNYIAADMSSAPPEVAIPTIESGLQYSRSVITSLKKLNLPVIFINPDNVPTDEAITRQYGVHVMIMKGVGHFLMMESPEHFNHMLMEAIQQI